MSKTNSLKTLILLLEKNIQGKILDFSEKIYDDPKVVHYYSEIIRYWNKLNYVINKTLRALKIKIVVLSEKALIFYIAYRVLFEKAPSKILLNEIKSSKVNVEKKFIESFLISLIKKINNFSWEIALRDKPDFEKISIIEAFPTFFIKRLLPVLSIEEIKSNMHHMNKFTENKSITFRVNTLNNVKKDRTINQDYLEELSKLEVDIVKDPNIDILYHISPEKKQNILNSTFYKEKNIVFQDKASISVVQVLSPQSNELICDMCAAPGMKSSLIAQITNNGARVIAGEFLTQRSKSMRNLIAEFNLFNTHLINTDSIIFPSRSKLKFDRVLLDAPCTGSGTFLNNPELKWRQNEIFLNLNVNLQEKLLAKAIDLLKTGGILVYATCSLYPEEGEMQIIKFGEILEPLELPKWFSPCYNINLSESAKLILTGTGRLFPSIHKTQGFFIGKFKKKVE